MSNKNVLSEIDNRDSNTTELVMDNEDRLEISFDESLDIVSSFITNIELRELEDDEDYKEYVENKREMLIRLFERTYELITEDDFDIDKKIVHKSD